MEQHTSTTASTKARHSPLHQVPYMRTSATVRRNSQQNTSTASSAGSSYLENIFAEDEQGCPAKQSSYSSTDSADRQVALLAVNAATECRNTGRVFLADPGSKPSNRIRSDLPEPSKLYRHRRTTKQKRRSSPPARSIKKHLAQLRHKCQDFNWGMPTVEIKNKHKPEEAVATVRRGNLKPATDPSTLTIPKMVKPRMTQPRLTEPRLTDPRLTTDAKIQSWDSTSTRPASSTSFPVSSYYPFYHDSADPGEIKKPESLSWGGGFQEPEYGEIPSYMVPPGKPSYLNQFHTVPVAPQIPDGCFWSENRFLQVYPADGVATATATATSSLGLSHLPASSNPEAEWEQVMLMMQSDEATKAIHYEYSRYPAENPFQSKFNED